jgi:hypothetical protein
MKGFPFSGLGPHWIVNPVMIPFAWRKEKPVIKYQQKKAKIVMCKNNRLFSLTLRCTKVRDETYNSAKNKTLYHPVKRITYFLVQKQITISVPAFMKSKKLFLVKQRRRNQFFELLFIQCGSVARQVNSCRQLKRQKKKKEKNTRFHGSPSSLPTILLAEYNSALPPIQL